LTSGSGFAAIGAWTGSVALDGYKRLKDG